MADGPWYGRVVRIIRKFLGRDRQTHGPSSVAELAGLYSMLLGSSDENEIDWVLDRMEVLERELGEEGVAQARALAELDARTHDSLMY